MNTIEDAAVAVATFSKTHEWPKEGSPEFFKFAQLLDNLATAINAKYPEFNRNIQYRTIPKGQDMSGMKCDGANYTFEP